MSPVWPPRRRRGSDPDVAVVRGVWRRLALLTIGCLIALVVVMLGVVFVTTRAALEQSLHDTLQARADANLGHLVEATRSGSDGTEPIQDALDSELTTGGIFLVVTDSHLRVVGGSASAFHGALPDPGTARVALAGRTRMFSQRNGPGGERYLLLSVPLGEQGSPSGLVQLGTSMHQYNQSVDDVLRQLLLVSALGLAAAAAITLVVVSRALLPIRRSLRRQRDFVADAAHELRTPVAILRTAAELGLESNDQEEQQGALEQALAEGMHLTRLVDDLSLLAHADSGVLSMEREPIDLASLVREAVSGVELLAEERGVGMRVEAPAALPFIGDWVRLRQLVLILLDNALKHTPDNGAIGIRLARQGNRLVLQVQDSGPGIDAADLGHLFDRFYRGARDRRIEGGGLGLAIGRWITEAHGGQIRAGNVVPHGALFTVTLPSP